MWFAKTRYLLTGNFGKDFDSLNSRFLIGVLKNYDFGKDFIGRVNVFLTYQESCVINGNHTKIYLQLERGARKCDPISVYLFVLVLELFFIIIKHFKNTHWINTFNHEKTFFVKDLDSIKNFLKMMDQFYFASGLLPNLTECKIAGIGSMKDGKVALCGLKDCGA